MEKIKQCLMKLKSFDFSNQTRKKNHLPQIPFSEGNINRIIKLHLMNLSSDGFNL